MNRKVLGELKKGVKARLRKIEINTWIFIGEFIIMLVLCVLHALGAGHYANFYPINGTFQDYNPVRRLLDGQIPYRDFQDYLGIGHLYLGAITTVLFGGTYKASLMAFTFLSFVGFAAILACLGIAVFKKREIAITVTNFLLLLLLIRPIFYSTIGGTDEIVHALNYALGNGNSARFVRGLVLPLSIFLLSLMWYNNKKLNNKRRKLKIREKLIIGSGYTGLVAGFSFIWSNDYGVSCWVCLSIMTFWVVLSKIRKVKMAILGLIIEIAASAIGVFLFIEIFTSGHLLNWLKSTFGTGGYQSWYYNSPKSYYLYDVDISYIILMQALLCLVYLYGVFKNRASHNSIVRYGIPAFSNMVSFCAVNEYKLLSGGELREVALSVLFATVLFESLNFLGQSLKNKTKIALVASIVVGLAWCISTLKEEAIFQIATNKDGTYIEELGGNITTYADDLLTTEQFLNGENFFATYASAQEVVCDKYQPSGTDYIIHVLGDDARKKYLDSFKTEDFKYTATINDTTDVEFSDWEHWAQRANWFFYRELYEEWHPVYANSYEIYWERNEKSDEDNRSYSGEVTIVDVTDRIKKIVIQTDASFDGTADVYIDYQVNKKGRFNSKLMFQRILKVQNTGVLYRDPVFEANYLPKEGREYIPIRVVNGYGEVTLTSWPERNTFIELKEVSCNKLFSVNYDYIEAIAVTDGDGYSYITVPQYAKYEDALNSATEITLDGIKYKIAEINQDDSYIYVSIITDRALNSDGMILSTGNMLRID